MTPHDDQRVIFYRVEPYRPPHKRTWRDRHQSARAFMRAVAGGALFVAAIIVGVAVLTVAAAIWGG